MPRTLPALALSFRPMSCHGSSCSNSEVTGFDIHHLVGVVRIASVAPLSISPRDPSSIFPTTDSSVHHDGLYSHRIILGLWPNVLLTEL